MNNLLHRPTKKRLRWIYMERGRWKGGYQKFNYSIVGFFCVSNFEYLFYTFKILEKFYERNELGNYL